MKPIKNYKNQAFTLVELIVVITILAILGTIAFVSLQGYSKDARDSTRISDLKTMQKSLSLYQTRNDILPLPDGGVEVIYSGGTVWTQGTFGDEVRANIADTGKMSESPIDPLTGSKYTYSVLNTRKEYQLGAVTEGTITNNTNHQQQLTQNILSTTRAGTEIGRAYVLGNYNGQMAKVSTGTTTYVLAIPSIITTEYQVAGTKLDLLQIVSSTNNKLVYRGYSNLPSSYTGTSYDMNGSPTLNLIKTPTNLVVYSGSISELSEIANLQILANNLQQAYTGTAIATQQTIQNILNTDTNDTAELTSNIGTVVNNSLGGAIIVSTTSGGGSTPTNSCVTQPTYTHATFTAGTPTTTNQAWQNTNSSNPCYYTCTDGYTGTDCGTVPTTPTNGVCGTDNGQNKTITPTNLCTAGTASSITDNGVGATYIWTCNGLDSGTNANCSANHIYGDWRDKDPNCDIADITIGTQIWAGCNSTLGNGIEWGSGTNHYCYNYAGASTSTDCINATYMASNKKEKDWSVATSNLGTQNTIWGKLYTFDNASSACPTGWHVPSSDEWTTLENILYGSVCRTNIENAWQCSGLGWLNNQTRTTTNNLVLALKIPLAGYRNTDGVTFFNRGRRTFFWSSTTNGASGRGLFIDYANTDVFRNSRDKTLGFSVRCVKD